MILRSHDRFNRFISYAFILHILFFAGLYFSNYLDFFKIRKPSKINIIKSSVRVDIVGMPKFTVQELKKMKLVPLSSKKEVQKQLKVNKEKIFKENLAQAKKKVNLSNLLGNISKKKVVEARKAKKKKVASKKLKQNLSKLVLEGNKISKGTAITGDTDYSYNEIFAEYVQSLPGVVKPFWKLPSYLKDQGLKCRIQIFISNTGKLINYRVIESSGVEEFDKRALATLKNVTSFPQPNVKIRTRVAAGEVILGFPL